MHAGHPSFCLTFVLHFQWPSFCVDSSSPSYDTQEGLTTRQPVVCESHEYRVHRGVRGSAGLHPTRQRQLSPAPSDFYEASVVEHLGGDQVLKRILQNVCTRRAHRRVRLLSSRTPAATPRSPGPLSCSAGAASGLNYERSESTPFPVAAALQRWRDWRWPSFVCRLHRQLRGKCKTGNVHCLQQQQEQRRRERSSSCSSSKSPRRLFRIPVDVSALEYCSSLHEVPTQCPTCGVTVPSSEHLRTSSLSASSACRTTSWAFATACGEPSPPSIFAGRCCLRSLDLLHFLRGNGSCDGSGKFQRVLPQHERRAFSDLADQTTPFLRWSETGVQERGATGAGRETAPPRMCVRATQEGEAGREPTESMRRRGRPVVPCGLVTRGHLISLSSALSAEKSLEGRSTCTSPLCRENSSSSFSSSGHCCATAASWDVRGRLAACRGSFAGQSCFADRSVDSSAGSICGPSSVDAGRGSSSDFLSEQAKHCVAQAGEVSRGLQMETQSKKNVFSPVLTDSGLVQPPAAVAAGAGAPGADSPVVPLVVLAASVLAAAVVAVASVVVAAVALEQVKSFLPCGAGVPLKLAITTGALLRAVSLDTDADARRPVLWGGKCSPPDCHRDKEEGWACRHAVAACAAGGNSAAVRNSGFLACISGADAIYSSSASSMPLVQSKAKLGVTVPATRSGCHEGDAAAGRQGSRGCCSRDCGDRSFLLNQGGLAKEIKVLLIESSPAVEWRSTHPETEAALQRRDSVTPAPNTLFKSAAETTGNVELMETAGDVKLMETAGNAKVMEAAGNGAWAETAGRAPSALPTTGGAASLNVARRGHCGKEIESRPPPETAAEVETAAGGAVFVQQANPSRGGLRRGFCLACGGFVGWTGGKESAERRRASLSGPGAFLTLAFAAGGSAAAAAQLLPLLNAEDARVCQAVSHCQKAFSQPRTPHAETALAQLPLQLQQQAPQQRGREQQQQSLQQLRGEQRRVQQQHKHQRQLRRWRFVPTGRSNVADTRLQEEGAEGKEGQCWVRLCCSAFASSVGVGPWKGGGGRTGEESAAEVVKKAAAARSSVGSERGKEKRMRAIYSTADKTEPKPHVVVDRDVTKKEGEETLESCYCLHRFAVRADNRGRFGQLWGLSDSCLLLLGTAGIAVFVALFVKCRGMCTRLVRCGSLQTSCSSLQQQFCCRSNRSSPWVLLLVLLVGGCTRAAARAPDALPPPPTTSARHALAPAQNWPAAAAAEAAADAGKAGAAVAAVAVPVADPAGVPSVAVEGGVAAKQRPAAAGGHAGSHPGTRTNAFDSWAARREGWASDMQRAIAGAKPGGLGGFCSSIVVKEPTAVHATVQGAVQPRERWLGGKGEFERSLGIMGSVLLLERSAIPASSSFFPSAEANSVVRRAVEERSRSRSGGTQTPCLCSSGYTRSFAFASVAAAFRHSRSPASSNARSTTCSSQVIHSSSEHCCRNSADSCRGSRSNTDSADSSSESCSIDESCVSESGRNRSNGDSRRRTGMCGEENMWGDAREEDWGGEEAGVRLLRLPLTTDNVLALFTLALLSGLGCMHLVRVAMEYFRWCKCRLCRGDYLLEYQLGSGGYGTVWVVRRRRDGSAAVHRGDSSLAVLKKIEVEEITEADSYQQEARRLAHLAHEHIVRYETDFIHREQPFGAVRARIYFMIVMEFCANGDLKQVVERSYRHLSEEKVRLWFHQLLQAVHHLHKSNVIHRDIKCQNVFLAKDGRVRLGDFGLSRTAGPPPGPQASRAQLAFGLGKGSPRFPAKLTFLSEKSSFPRRKIAGQSQSKPLLENTCAAVPRRRQPPTAVSSGVGAEACRWRQHRLHATLSRPGIHRAKPSERGLQKGLTRICQAEKKKEAETSAAGAAAVSWKKQAFPVEALPGTSDRGRDKCRNGAFFSAVVVKDEEECQTTGRSQQRETTRSVCAPVSCSGGGTTRDASVAGADLLANSSRKNIRPTNRRETHGGAASPAAVAVEQAALSNGRSPVEWLRACSAEEVLDPLVVPLVLRAISWRWLPLSPLRWPSEGSKVFCARSLSTATDDTSCTDSSGIGEGSSGAEEAPSRATANKCVGKCGPAGKRFFPYFRSTKPVTSASLTLAEPSLLSQAGTGCYMAPEVLNNAAYGKAADMWSLGCVLLELCSGVFMWELEKPLAFLVAEDAREGDSSSSTLDTFLHSVLPRHVITEGTRALIKQLLQTDPSRRPTTADLLQSSYFVKSRKVFQFPFCWSPSLASAMAVRDAQSEPAGRATITRKYPHKASARREGKEGHRKRRENLCSAEDNLVRGAQGRSSTNEEEEKQNKSATARSARARQMRTGKVSDQKTRCSLSRSSLLDESKSKTWKCGGTTDEKSEIVVLVEEEHACFTPWAQLAGIREQVFTLLAESWCRRLQEVIWQLRWFSRKAIRTPGSYELFVQGMKAGCLVVDNVVSFFDAVPALLRVTFVQPLRWTAWRCMLWKKSDGSVHNSLHAEKEADVKMLPRSRVGDAKSAVMRLAGTPNAKRGSVKSEQKDGKTDRDNVNDVSPVSSGQGDFAYIDPCFWDVVYSRKYGRSYEE